MKAEQDQNCRPMISKSFFFLVMAFTIQGCIVVNSSEYQDIASLEVISECMDKQIQIGNPLIVKIRDDELERGRYILELMVVADLDLLFIDVQTARPYPDSPSFRCGVNQADESIFMAGYYSISKANPENKEVDFYDRRLPTDLVSEEISSAIKSYSYPLFKFIGHE